MSCPPARFNASIDAKYLSKIQTGDLLLFSNWTHGGLGIRLATASPWNHVGIAIWLQSQEQLELLANQSMVLPIKVGRAREEPAQLYCFETNDNVVYDRLSGTLDTGARLAHIETLIPKYSQVAWRPVNVVRSAEFYQRLWAFIEEFTGAPYHRNKLRMVLSALEVYLDSEDPPGPDSFCSQLVARYLQRFGVLSLVRPAYTYLPRHFSWKDSRISPEVFHGPEETIYSRNDFQWYWIVCLVVITLFAWLAILGLNRYRYYKAIVLTSQCDAVAEQVDSRRLITTEIKS